LESSDHAWARDVLRNATTIVPLDNLVHGFSGLDEQGALVAYAESATAAEILCAQLGAKDREPSYRSSGMETPSTRRFSVSDTADAFHSEWRRRVGLR